MKGTLILVSSGKGHLGNKLLPIPKSIHRLFIADGIPITPFITSLILRAESNESIAILQVKDLVSWDISINNLWSISKEGQILVVVAPNKDIFKIAESIAPRGCRLMLSTYHPPGDVLISIDGDDGFEIIAS